MKILLDTNIILHREAKDPKITEIGKLFFWIDRLGYEKYIHKITLNEISKIQDPVVRNAFLVKIDSYQRLNTIAPRHPDVSIISQKYDLTENDQNDTILVNELFTGRVDLLLTEDKKIHAKASDLGLAKKVFTIASFLKKVNKENPEFLDYNALLVRRVRFGDIDVNDEFFDSLRQDYKKFNRWFEGKAEEWAYVCRINDKIQAFLYLKVENEHESYIDITPSFSCAKRLKIGTFKVKRSGAKLGERLIKILFDNALHFAVKEIYFTIFPRDDDHSQLIVLLKEFGFHYHGVKKSSDGNEEVYVRDFSKTVSRAFPKITYPFVSNQARKYMVAIYPHYHTSLFPDSALQNESNRNSNENEPHQNAIEKVFVSRSPVRDMAPGDILIFYKTGGQKNGGITTLGVVENVVMNISDFNQFEKLCRKRSVFLNEGLKKEWDRNPSRRPFIVNFLHCHTFPEQVRWERLKEIGILRSAPMGFRKISEPNFEKIVQETGSNDIIVN